MSYKKTVVTGAIVAAVTIGGVGATHQVAAATPPQTDDTTTLVDKIATKFKLNKTDVKAVFDEDRAARQSERQAAQAERLSTAVKEGKLTQSQADYITKAWADISSLRGAAGSGKPSDSVRTEIKSKMDALRSWAEENNVDRSYISPHGRMGHGGRAQNENDRPAATKPTENN